MMKLVFLCLTLLMGMSESVEPDGLPEPYKCDQSDERCEKLEGTCVPSYYSRYCDYTHNEMCQEGRDCTCCIDCDKTKCANGLGTCRYCECNANEYHFNKAPCPYSGCMCCKQCDTTRECVGGLCVREVDKYLQNGYIVNPNVMCPQLECSCVQRCYDRTCSAKRGTCMANSQMRMCDSQGNMVAEELCGENCFCCIPKFSEPCVDERCKELRGECMPYRSGEKCLGIARDEFCGDDCFCCIPKFLEPCVDERCEREFRGECIHYRSGVKCRGIAQDDLCGDDCFCCTRLETVDPVPLPLREN